MISRRRFIASTAAVAATTPFVTRAIARQDHAGHGSSTPMPMICSATPMAGHDDMHGTPVAQIPYDQAYIDMMIPHHQSIIDLAMEAKDQLSDSRLVEIAQAILDTQPAEIDELAALREQWYSDADPAPLDATIMSVSMGMDHGCTEQGHMEMMSSEWQLKTFEAADDKDLAFIDQTIPHHEMAVVTSEVALERAEHQEIVDIATRVIEAQEAEIATLTEIRAELAG